MPSSIKMIKSTDVVGGMTSAKIETEIEEKIYEPEHTYEEDPGEMQLKIAQKKGQELLAQAEQKRQALIEETHQEIEELKKSAYEEAYQLGLQNGQQEGYQDGLAQGLQQAEAENTKAKAEIQQMFQEAEAAVAAYQADKKAELIQLAAHMAEKIVHNEIDASDKGILQLAEPYFYQLDKDEEFVSITVHPSQRENIEKQLPAIEMSSPNTRFLVFADSSLETRGILIESSKAVIDLQIKHQVAAMLQEFEEMERTVDA